MGPTILLIAGAVFLLLGFLIGLARGIGRSTIRLVTLLLAIVLVFLITVPIAKLLLNIDISGLLQLLPFLPKEINGVPITSANGTIEALTQGIPEVSDFLSENPTLTNFVLALPVLLVSIPLFYPIWFMVFLVSLILYAILKNPLMRLFTKDKNLSGKKTAGSRLGGAGVGLVAGFVAFAMLFVPIFGLLNISDKVFEASGSVATEAKANYESYTKNPAVAAARIVGFGALGNLFLRQVSSFEAEDGTKLAIVDEIDNLADVIVLFLDNGGLDGFPEHLDYNKIEELIKQKPFSTSLIRVMLNSKLLVKSAPYVARKGGVKLAETMGLPKNNAEAYNKMTDSIAETMDAKSEELELNHAYDQYQKGNVIIESGNAYLRVTDVPMGNFVRFRVRENGGLYVLTNDNSKPLSIGRAPEGGATFTGELTPVDDVKKAAQEVGDAIAKILCDNVVGKRKDDEARVMLGNVASGLVEKAGADLCDGKSSVVTADVSDALEQTKEKALQKDSFTYSGQTGESLGELFSTSVQKLLEEEPDAAAELLSGLLTPMMGMLLPDKTDDKEPSSDQQLYIPPEVGQVLNTVRDSEALSGVGETLLDIVSESPLTENIPSEVMDSIKDAYSDKDTDIGGVASAAISAIDLFAADPETGSDIQLKAISGLLSSLTPNTVGTLKNLLTLEFLTALIGNETAAQEAKKLVDQGLDILASEAGSADFEKDSLAVQKLYSLIIAKGSLNPMDLLTIAPYAEESPLVAKMLHFCTEYKMALSAAQKSEFKTALVNAYNSSKAAVDVKKPIYTDIATIAGVSVSF